MNFYRLIESSARRQPAATAIELGGRVTSYRTLEAETVLVANALRGMGVSVGDRVLMFAPNRAEGIVLYLACAYIGAVYVPVNAGFARGELEYILKNAEPTIAFVDPSLVDLLSAASDAVGRSPRVLELPTDGFGEELERHASDSISSPVDVAPEHGVLITYTSGSTARPKPVLRSHRAEAYAAQTYARAWDVQPGERGIVAMSLAWAYGLCSTSMSFLSVGASVDLFTHFNPVRVLEGIEARGANIFVGTTTMYNKLLDVLKSRTFDLSTMRLWSVGGEPVPETTLRAFERQVGRRVYQAYGSSEVYPLVVARPTVDGEPPRLTAGKLVQDAELRLVDATGADIPIGAPGEAWGRCPGMFNGYFGEPEITAERVTPDGWFKFGDILTRDEQGWFYVVGRASDVIIRGGANVSPGEIESVLLDREDVGAAVVVGIPDETYGEAILALVVGQDGTAPDPAQLRQHVAAAVARYKVPQAIWITDRLPLNPNGKLDRAAVRRLVNDDLRDSTNLADRSAPSARRQEGHVAPRT